MRWEVVACSALYVVGAAAYGYLTGSAWMDEKVRRRRAAVLFLLFPAWPLGVAYYLTVYAEFICRLIDGLRCTAEGLACNDLAVLVRQTSPAAIEGLCWAHVTPEAWSEAARNTGSRRNRRSS